MPAPYPPSHPLQRSRPPVILAVDLGGSSLRAALLDEQAREIARFRLDLAVTVAAVDQSEADPEPWWRGLIEAAEALHAAAPEAFARLGAIAISAFTRSQVFVDHAGNSLRLALLWRDTRAEAVLPDLQALCPADHPERPILNAFHPLARLVWLQRHEPAVLAQTAAILEPKDFLNLRLTGIAALDSVASARLVAAATPRAGTSLFKAAGLDTSLLPPVLPPTAIMGHVQPGLPGVLGRVAGIPVLAMANDTWASVVGLGAMRPGLGYNLSGTTEVFGILSDQPARAEGLMGVTWGEGLFQLGGPSQAGGDTIRWLGECLGLPAEELGPALDILLDGPRATAPLLFLPYLLGERVPYWDPDLRAAFLGLSRLHGPADLAWAVLEGVACLNRVVLERAEAGTGMVVREIRFGGGGARNRHWQQVKADCLGRPVAVPDHDDEGLRGAAIVALAALGHFPDLAAAQESLVRPGRICLPDPAQQARWAQQFALFRQAESALAPLSHALARLGRAGPA